MVSTSARPSIQTSSGMARNLRRRGSTTRKRSIRGGASPPPCTPPRVRERMEAFGGPRWVTAGVNPAYRHHPPVNFGSDRGGWTEAVAASADGDDDRGVLGIGLELNAQPLDERAQVVPLVAVTRTPDRAQQRPMVHNLARLLGQRRKQAVLRGREADLDAVAKHRLSSEIHHHVSDPCGFGLRRRLLHASEHRAQPGQELVGAERLGKIVVGSHVECADLVALLAAGADHYDGGDPSSLQRGQDAPAVHERQPYVQQHHVVAAGLELAGPRGAVSRGADREPVSLQGGPDRIPQRRIVLDDQDLAHPASRASGSVKRKGAPGSPLSSPTPPRECPSASPFTMARPSRVPPELPLPAPRKKRSKIRSRRSAGMPGPRSLTLTVTPPDCSCATATLIGVE